MKSHASMNRIYRLVWNNTLGVMVAVAENAKGRGKSSTSRGLVAGAVALTGGLFLAPFAQAGPSGGQVVSGAGSVSQSGATTTITQTSQNLSLNWKSFNVAPQETVNFVQPSASAIAVNRIFDTNGSQILGHLNANGQVYLINPNGILFGSGAQINVGGLVASTLDLHDTSLNGNARTFSGNGTGSIVNKGTINATNGGFVALLGNTVSNQGTITAQLGTVALGAGSAATLNFNGNSLVKMQIDQGVLNSLADNGGLIRADGGRVIMTAGAKEALLASVVNNTGKIEARSVESRDGNITLLGGDIGLQADAVFQSGTLDASSISGRGGNIAINASRVVLLDGALHADGVQGGQVSVTAPHIGQSAAITAQGSSTAGGSITLAGEQIVQSVGAQLRAGSAQGDGGRIDVRALASDASGHLFSSGQIDATGQHGGSVLLTGDTVDLYGASINASGLLAGGQVLIGGDYQGRNAEVPNAQRTTLNAYTRVAADATQSGNGGKVIVWSDQHTSFAGNISARGGATGGNGGFIEVSGKETLAFSGTASAAAPLGQRGTLLLDPKNIVIESAPASAFTLIALANPDPLANDGHGSNVKVLANDNIVVVAANDSFTATSAGAVYLYDGHTGALISALRGSTANDQVGNGGVTVLSNGNYVVSSTGWDNGSLLNAGAATWGSGTSGVTGVVSAANSLVGSSANDYVGSGITALSNGNYVVSSTSWDNGSITNAGAVTWGSGTSGVTGVVSEANSLVGSRASDSIGSGAVTALSNGNYVVLSTDWDNGSITNAGAVTWGSGTSGISGVVSEANSLVGSSANDRVGSFGSGTGSGVTALSNGNYVVSSANWDNGSFTNAGAVTWGSGTSGISGVVSAANSLVGSTANDRVGSFGGDNVGANGITALSNGNYVVSSSNWQNGSIVLAGAATWGSGTSGIQGVVSTANSLVGSSIYDSVGNYGVTALNNGNYVVSSFSWNNGSIVRAGAVTWGSGNSGISGAVSTANSLVGSSANDFVGDNGVAALSNGNYVVSSFSWNNGSILQAGAATWGSGTSGVQGVVSAANSLVGSSTGDRVGYRVTALSNGNYVVSSASWDNGSILNAGAVTWGSGTSGISGVVSVANSLVGSSASESVGLNGATALGNGNYVVGNFKWANGSNLNAGSVTWGSGTSGIKGVVSAANSLVGSSAGDGVYGVTALSDGNYVVSSAGWDNGSLTNAGAVTWGSGTSGIKGVVSAANSLVGSSANDLLGNGGVTALSNGNFVVGTASVDLGGLVNSGAAYIYVPGGGGSDAVSTAAFATNAGANSRIDPAAIKAILDGGTAVVLQANNDITVNNAIAVAGTTGGALTLQAGRSILFNANITTANGNLTAIANDASAIAAQRDSGAGNIGIGTGVTLNVGTGTATLAGQNFINNSGANALQTTGSGKWRVWSTSPANDTRGGLASNFKQYNALQGVTAVAQASGNGFLYTLAPTMSASLIGNVTKTYDGTTAAILSSANYSASGAVDGDSVVLNNPTSGTFDTKDAGTGKTVSVSGMAVTSASNGATVVYGYDVNATASGVIGTIDAAALSAISMTGTRAYDGTANVAAGIFTLSGLVNGENLNLTGVGTVTDKNVGNNKTVTLGNLALGDGTGGGSNGLASNYTFAGGTQTASITQAALTLSTGNVTKTYDSGLTAAATVTVSAGTVFAGDTLSGGSFAFTDKNVGSANKTVALSGVTVGDGVNNGNYNVSYANNTTSTITAANLSVTGLTASAKVYDTTLTATLGGTAAVNALTGDSVTLGGTASGVFSDKNVGTGKAVSVTGNTITGTDAGNYNLLQQSGLTADINKANLSVTGITASAKVYDTNTVATLGGTAAVAALGSDVVTLGGSASGAFADKNVGSAKGVSVTGNTITGTDAGNYNLQQQTGLSAGISKANLAVTGITAGHKVYDTNTAATLGGTAAVTALTGDSVTLGGSASGAFADKNAATGKAVSVTGNTITGTDAGNYNLLQQTGLSADISKANLSVSGLTVGNKVYDSNTTASLGGTAVVAALTGDSVTLGGSASGAFANKNVATGKAVSVSGNTLTGTDAGNYNLVQQAGLTADITKADLGVSGLTASAKVYNANTVATLGGTAAVSALTGDSVTLGGSASGVFADKNVGTGKSVTVSGNTLGGADAGNYNLLQQTGLSAGISKANLAVTGITAGHKVYDTTSVATLGGTAVIAALGSDVVNVTGSGSGTFANSNVGSDKTVTVSGFSLSGKDAGNYAVMQPTGITADITAPEQVRNVITQLASTVLAPTMGVQPGALSLSPSITVAQNSSPVTPSSNSGSVAAGETSPSKADKGPVVNVTMNIGTLGSTLQIISGGVKLPGNIVNVNE